MPPVSLSDELSSHKSRPEEVETAYKARAPLRSSRHSENCESYRAVSETPDVVLSRSSWHVFNFLIPRDFTQSAVWLLQAFDPILSGKCVLLFLRS